MDLFLEIFPKYIIAMIEKLKVKENLEVLRYVSSRITTWLQKQR